MSILKRLAIVLLVLPAGCVTEQSNVRPADPEHASELYTELGFGYLKQNHLDLAAEKFGRARKLSSNNVRAIYGMGLTQFAQGRTIEGRALIDEAADKVGDETALRKTIAQWYCGARDPERAGKLLQPVIRSGDPDSIIRWSECLLQNRRPIDSENVLWDAIRDNPRGSQYLLVLANRSVLQQDWLRARMLLNRYEDVAPTGSHSAVLGLRCAIALNDAARRAQYADYLSRANPILLEQIDPATGGLRSNER